MEKGFTLIELIIVMVVISVLVALAIPQYQRSVERGRALIGLSNIRTVADRLNSIYFMEGSYPTAQEFGNLDFELVSGDFFAAPTFTTATGHVEVARRGSSGWNYKFAADLSEGEISRMGCIGDDCGILGLDAY